MLMNQPQLPVSSSTASTPTTQSSINSSQSIESSSRGQEPETKTQIVLRMMKAMKDGKILICLLKH